MHRRTRSARRAGERSATRRDRRSPSRAAGSPARGPRRPDDEAGCGSALELAARPTASGSPASARATASTSTSAGRCVQLGADRRYTGPDCPPELLEDGRHPAGRLRAGSLAPLLGRLGGLGRDLRRRASSSTSPASTSSSRSAPPRARCGFTSSSTPPPRRACAPSSSATGLPALLPEWAYGHWKSRDVYEHQDDVEDDWRGYRDNELPLDAIVIDSPWETQYNTWRFNPHQFPDAAGPGRARCGRTGSGPWSGSRPGSTSSRSTGSARRTPSPRGCTASRPRTTPEGAERGHYVRAADGEPYVGRWWMGTGSIVDFTSEAARDWWRELARPRLRARGRGGQGRRRRGLLLPSGLALRRRPQRRRGRLGRTGASTARRPSRRSTQSTARAAASSSAAPAGPASRRSGCSGAATRPPTSGPCAPCSPRC